jgi:hypothetical protein
MAIDRTGRGPEVLAVLLELEGKATCGDVARRVFGASDEVAARSSEYMAAYNWLRALEGAGAVTRERVAPTPGRAPHYVWTAVPGVDAPATSAPNNAWRHGERRPGGKPWRRVRLTERMWLVLLGALNDAVLDDPDDPDLPKLRNIVKAAAIVGDESEAAE